MLTTIPKVREPDTDLQFQLTMCGKYTNHVDNEVFPNKHKRCKLGVISSNIQTIKVPPTVIPKVDPKKKPPTVIPKVDPKKKPPHMNSCLKGLSNTQQRDRDLLQDYMGEKNTKYQSLKVGSKVTMFIPFNQGKQDGNRYLAKVLAIPCKSNSPNIFRIQYEEDGTTELHDMATTNFSIIQEPAKVVVTNIKRLPFISSSSDNYSYHSYDGDDFSHDSIDYKILKAQF